MTRILVGSSMDRLKELEDGSVHCCVTSPPYWGLRAYKGDDGMIGLEPTFDGHLDNLVAVFREVRRVLRDDGTLWLNYGDAYVAARGGTHMPAETLAGGVGGYTEDGERTNRNRYDGYSPRRDAHRMGFKHKDLMMMPARVAMALQADGWWLRSEIVWHKPNPRPESMKDRPTSAHEKLFLLTPGVRYFYDSEAVRVPAIHAGRVVSYDGTQKNTDHENRTYFGKGGARDVTVGSHANLRNVWSIATSRFRDAHFATFPPALVEPCIRAGTSERGACVECGAPWRRVVARGELREHPDRENRNVHAVGDFDGDSYRPDGGTLGMMRETKTTGWESTCDCRLGFQPRATRPCTVLDPFGGAGTVGLVAASLQRDAVLIEISPEYAAMAERRIRDDAPLLNDVRLSPAG